MVAADIDPDFITQAIVLGVISFVLAVCFTVALIYEPRRTGSGSGSDAKTGLDWWCRRIGLTQSLVCVVWSVDLRGALGIYSQSFAWVLTATATALLFAYASAWIYFHSTVLYRQLKRPHPTYLSHVLIAIPILDWVGQCMAFVLAFELDREWLNQLGRLVFCTSVVTYMVLTSSVSIVLRMELTRFVQQTLPAAALHPALQPTATTSPTATPPTVLTSQPPAFPTAPAPLNTAVTIAATAAASPKAAFGATAEPARPTVPASGVVVAAAGIVIDVSHIYSALRTLSVVTTILLLIGGFSVFDSMLDIVSSDYGIQNTGLATRPLKREFDIGNSFVPMLIWLIILMKLYYCWPLYRPNTTPVSAFKAPTARAAAAPAHADGSPALPAPVRQPPVAGANRQHDGSTLATRLASGTGNGPLTPGSGGVEGTSTLSPPPDSIVAVPAAANAYLTAGHATAAAGLPVPVLVSTSSAMRAPQQPNALLVPSNGPAGPPRTDISVNPSVAGGDDASRVVASNRVQFGVDNRDRWRAEVPAGTPPVASAGVTPHQSGPVVSYNLNLSQPPVRGAEPDVTSLNPGSQFVSGSARP